MDAIVPKVGHGLDILGESSCGCDRIGFKLVEQHLEQGESVKTKAKFGVGVAIILVTLSCLAYVGAQQSKTYYHTISEIPTLNGSALHQRLRVGGDVKNGSIQHYSGRVDFVLVEQGKVLPVSYVGTDPLPDTFKDGAQCLVEGKVQPDGRFVAETVQAKCASKYEAAPGGQSQPGSTSDSSYPNGKS
jgi:cytochrome c-type biogenesis protein CcmE